MSDIEDDIIALLSKHGSDIAEAVCKKTIELSAELILKHPEQEEKIDKSHDHFGGVLLVHAARIYTESHLAPDKNEIAAFSWFMKKSLDELMNMHCSDESSSTELSVEELAAENPSGVIH